MRVLVGMSGGIDSTAVCMMLKEQGHEVLGLTIRNTDRGLRPGQDEPDYVLEARSLAARIGIGHYVADERASFDRDVAAPFAGAWLDGLTPNPCIECNPGFKFRVLLEWADRLGFIQSLTFCPFVIVSLSISICALPFVSVSVSSLQSVLLSLALQSLISTGSVLLPLPPAVVLPSSLRFRLRVMYLGLVVIVTCVSICWLFSFV